MGFSIFICIVGMVANVLGLTFYLVPISTLLVQCILLIGGHVLLIIGTIALFITYRKGNCVHDL